MTGRSLAVQGGLAVLGLVTVYATWQREPERAPGAVTVIDASKSDVTMIHYEDDATAVDLTRGKTGNEAGVWLHLVTKPKAEAKPDPKADPKAPAKPPAKPAATPPPRDLPGAENAKKLYDQFAPLTSLRAFGVLEATKLKELGLDNPKRKLEVTVKGAVRRYEIGQPAAQSAGEAFLRDTRDGRVYLMPRNILSELQNASHMVDRRLHTFELGRLRSHQAVRGRQDEGVRPRRPRIPHHLGVRAGEDPRQARSDGQELARRPLARVSDRAARQGRGARRRQGHRRAARRLHGRQRQRRLDRDRADARAGQRHDGRRRRPDDGEIYARTEHTAGWAKIPSGGQIVPDAQKLIAAP